MNVLRARRCANTRALSEVGARSTTRRQRHLDRPARRSNMSSDAALAFASLWLTYLIRSVGAYLLLWVLCRLIRYPQLRFRLCGIFLGGMVAAWLGLLLLTSL